MYEVIAPNYVKVVVYREPGRKFFPLGDADVFAGGNQFGPEDARTRIDSYIWPFSTRSAAADALSSALALYGEAKTCGLRARIVVAVEDVSLFGVSQSILGVAVHVVAPSLPGAGVEDYGD